MQITNKFWKQSFNRQVVVDWDDFINEFSSFTEKYSKIVLDPVQKNYLKNIIDPQNAEQINIGQFFAFLEKYWIIPSNRTNIFKHKFKPVAEPKAEQWRGLVIKVKLEGGQVSQYIFKKRIVKKGQNGNSKQLLTKNFLRIGASQMNDLMVDSIYTNEFHLKVIMGSNEFFIRDISKSNRTRLKLDRSVILKKGMVFCLGDHEIVVLSVQNGRELTEKLSFYIDLDMSSFEAQSIYKRYGITTQESVEKEHLSEENQFSEGFGQSSKVIQGQTQIEVRNIKTRQSIKYLLQKSTSLGKSVTSGIQIQDIKIPQKACSIEYTNFIWTFKAQQNADVTLNLANQDQLRNTISSNRQVLQDGYTVITKDLEISFEYLHKPQEY